MERKVNHDREPLYSNNYNVHTILCLLSYSNMVRENLFLFQNRGGLVLGIMMQMTEKLTCG